MFNYNKLFFASPYEELANKELSWLPADTHERYLENLKLQKNKLDQYGWLDKKITYKFNSLGFRCDEFTDRPAAMFLGCSFTLGVGMPIEESWAQLVAKELNLACANLGIGGGSADCAFRLCLGYIDRIKPKLVVYNQPPTTRIELIAGYSIRNILLTDNLCEYKCQYLDDYIMSDTNIELNAIKNLFAIKLLCQERNIKFLYFDNYTQPFSPLATSDFARDLMHLGTVHNQEFARQVLSQI